MGSYFACNLVEAVPALGGHLDFDKRLDLFVVNDAPGNSRSPPVRSIKRGETQYTGNRGLPELLSLISRYLAERFGVHYPPEHIIVTAGAYVSSA